MTGNHLQKMEFKEASLQKEKSTLDYIYKFGF